MASVQKALAKVAGVSLVLLAACSSDSLQAPVSGDRSYLDAAPLAETARQEPILPITTKHDRYSGHEGGDAVGKALDIRPPAQPLAERRACRSLAIPLRYWWKMVVAARCIFQSSA